ncbi:MAG: hypothetical protein HY900_13305 [Deltaproteobacteria bacterium]|nr:hypothetical protein [Deltaproteobacteria bacterium]
MAVKHGLRSFDAVHLAAALELMAKTREASLAFSSFDHSLNKDAGSEGLGVLEPPGGL